MTRGALHLTVCAFLAAALAPSARGLEVRVRPTPGGPQIHVDGRPVAPRFFFGGDRDMPDGAPSPFFRTLACCREAGVRFVSLGVDFGWREDGEDWSLLDGFCDKIVKAYPEALIVPRVFPDFAGWVLKRPAWLMELKGRGKVASPSIFAPGYRDALRAHLVKFVRHMRARYPNNFAGVHVAAQAYGEFFYYDSRGPWLHGYEPSELVAWRKHLAARGAADAATASIPSDEARQAHTHGLLLDSATDRRTVEFANFEQRAMADFVADLSATIRQASDGKCLSVFFYGYGFEHADTLNGPAHSGTYSLGYLLERAAGDIDILAAPLSYAQRRYPAPYITQGAAESVGLHGVLWLDEDDTRTYLSVGNTQPWASLEVGGWIPTTKEETLDQLRRNLSAAIRHGRASWFMDLPSMGWYADRDLWRVVEELRPADEAALTRTRPYAPPVALVLDERGMLFASARSLAALRPLVGGSRLAFAAAGAEFGQYLSGDVLAGAVPARLQVWLSTFFAGAPTRARIAAGRRPGLTRVWCWAPGYLDRHGADIENIFRTTGFQARRLPAQLPEVHATPVGRRAGWPETVRGEGTVDPLFAVDAADEETLARWPDGSPAVAVRRRADGGSEVFMGIPAWTPESARALIRLADAK